MKLLFDLHTHTIVSGHAYSTLRENIDSAKEKGLLAYGVSEHSYEMEGTVHPVYFQNYKVVPHVVNGVRILVGAELNILDRDGNVDCNDHMYENLDYLIASLHSNIIVPGTAEENMNALLKVFENPKIKIIGHPDDSRFPLDYEILAREAAQSNTVLEVNNSSLSELSYRMGAQENVRKMLAECMKYNTRVIVNSDAHYCDDVGNFERALKIIGELDFPEELIVNASIDGLKYVLNDSQG